MGEVFHLESIRDKFSVIVVRVANARAFAETRAWVTPNGRAIYFPMLHRRGEAAPQIAAAPHRWWR